MASNKTTNERTVRETPNYNLDLDEVNKLLKERETINASLRMTREILTEDAKQLEKVDRQKVETFIGFLQPLYAAIPSKATLMNKIFDDHAIDSAEKGYLMKEMGLAAKKVMPEYRHKHIREVMDNVDSWIRLANALRVTNKSGSKIHPTELGGRYKFRWHIMYFKQDYEKQRDNLKIRVQDADKTLQNRANEWIDLSQKKEEAEKQQQEITVATDVNQEKQEEVK